MTEQVHHHPPKRQNISQYEYRHSQHMPASTAVDPALEAYNTAASSSADFNQLLLPGPGLEGPGLGLPRPAYPSQINDLEPLTQDTQLPSVGHHEPEANPSLNSQPEPWNQQFVNGGPFQYPLARPYSAWTRMNYSVPRTQQWPYSTSEVDCSISGRCPPDSGYNTKSPASQSIFSGEFPASSQQSLTGAMNDMGFTNEQMRYIYYSTEGVPRVPQEAHGFYAEQSYADHQTDNRLEWTCKECEPPQNFKNKSEYKYAQIERELRLSMTDWKQQTQTSPREAIQVRGTRL